MAGDLAQCTDLVGIFRLLETVDETQTDEKRDGSEDAETAVNETPEQRDATERAGDESEGNDRDAGDYAELKHPSVAHWVSQWPEKGDGENEMGEGKPVGAIGEEGIAEAGIAEGIAHFRDPKMIGVGKMGCA